MLDKKYNENNFIRNPKIWIELPDDWPCKCIGCSMGGGVVCKESLEKYGYLLIKKNRN